MTVDVSAKELVAEWLLLDAGDSRSDDARRVVESLGSDVESSAARVASAVRSPLAEVSAHQADGGEIAEALADLRRQMDALDPAALADDRGWFARTLGKVPGVGTPGARYLQRLESSRPRVNLLVESLDNGRGVLSRDNVTLRADRDRLHELSASLDAAISAAGKFQDALVFAVDVELAFGDPRRPMFEDELLVACRRRMSDLGRAHVVNQQTAMAIESVMDDNRNLIVGIDRIRELALERAGRRVDRWYSASGGQTDARRRRGRCVTGDVRRTRHDVRRDRAATRRRVVDRCPYGSRGHPVTATGATMRSNFKRTLAAGVAAMVVAASCGGSDDSAPLDREDAASKLTELVDEIGWIDDQVTRSASIPPPIGANLADTLPSIDEFEIVVVARSGDSAGAVEIWASTEKSGDGTDGWMTERGRSLQQLGSHAGRRDTGDGVALRRIASGTGYQYIARGQELPDAFSPSNELWIEMAGEFQTMTEVRPRLVDNVAGIVMKNETADELRATYGELSAENLVDAVIAGDLVMGYTDPFASSTGLNFLLTVLDSIAEGDEAQLTSPDVASVFEQFQRQVPFVALTTLQMRDSVENDTGTLDTFVMEWQTYTNTDSLQSGFEFIPFGVRHDNPLYAVGDLTAAEAETLELFAEFAADNPSTRSWPSSSGSTRRPTPRRSRRRRDRR